MGELFESVDKMLSCAYANALTNRYLLFRFDSKYLRRPQARDSSLTLCDWRTSFFFFSFFFLFPKVLELSP